MSLNIAAKIGPSSLILNLISYTGIESGGIDRVYYMQRPFYMNIICWSFEPDH